MAQSTYFKCPTCGQSRRDAERVYSEFHYAASASRFISREDAERLANINIDRSFWIECHHRSFKPFALIESAVDIGQSRKTVTAIANLAMLAKIPAYLVLFTMSDNLTGKVDITKLRVQCVWSPVRPKPTRSRFGDRKSTLNGYWTCVIVVRIAS